MSATPKRQLHILQLRSLRSTVRVAIATIAVRKNIRNVMLDASKHGVITHAIDAHSQAPQLDDRIFHTREVSAALVSHDHNHPPATLFRAETEVAKPLAGRKGRGKHVFYGVTFIVAFIFFNIADRLLDGADVRDGLLRQIVCALAEGSHGRNESAVTTD